MHAPETSTLLATLAAALPPPGLLALAAAGFPAVWFGSWTGARLHPYGTERVYRRIGAAEHWRLRSSHPTLASRPVTCASETQAKANRRRSS